MFIFQEKAVDANVPVIVFVEDMAASLEALESYLRLVGGRTFSEHKF